MSQVRVAKGIRNQSLLKQTRFSNSLASKQNTKTYLRSPPKKYKNTAKYEQVNVQLHWSKSGLDWPMNLDDVHCFLTAGGYFRPTSTFRAKTKSVESQLKNGKSHIKTNNYRAIYIGLFNLLLVLAPFYTKTIEEITASHVARQPFIQWPSWKCIQGRRQTCTGGWWKNCKYCRNKGILVDQQIWGVSTVCKRGSKLRLL